MNRLKTFFSALPLPYRAALLLGALFLTAGALIWPGRLFFRADKRVVSISEPHTQSERLGAAPAGRSLSGSFVGTGRELKALGFRVAALPEEEGRLTLSLYDENGTELTKSSLSGKSLKNNEYAELSAGFFAREGETYSFSLGWEAGFSDASSGAGLVLQLASPDSLPWEALYAWYEGEQVPVYPVMSFLYSMPFELSDALPWWMSMGLILILLFGALGVWRSKAAPYLAILFVAFYACSALFLTDEAGIPVRLTGKELENVKGTHDYDYVGISERADLAGTMAKTKEFTLNPGTYRIGVGYLTDTAYNTVTLYDNGTLIREFSLDPTVRYREEEITLEKGSQFFLTEFNYSGQGMFIVNSFSLIPEGGFYTDHAYLSILILLAAAAGMGMVFFLRKRARQGRPISGKGLVCGGLLVGLAVFAMHPYFIGYLPYGDDVCYHLIRIEGVKDALVNGQVPAVLYPEGVLGKGYLGFMYPAFFLYFPAVLRIFGVSTALSWKSLVFVFHLLCAFGTFSCVRLITGSRKGGLFAAVLYTLFPYRLACFIARAALGEALAFSFFPFLLAGLWLILYAREDAAEAGGKLKTGTKGVILLTVGFSGLLHTHVLSCMIGFLLCLIFGILRFGGLIREKRYIPVLQAAGLTILVNLWFILPFIDLYLHGGLDSEALAWSTYREYSLLPVSLFGTFTSGDYRMYSLGVPILAGLALYPFVGERDRGLRSFLTPCAVLGGMFTLMTLNLFPAYPLMEGAPLWKSLLTTLQFPWRLLGIAGLLFILAGTGALFGKAAEPSGSPEPRLSLPGHIADILGFGLMLLALAMVPRYDTSGGDYYAYESYDSEYTAAHYLKLIGIPKTENTIVYPYEWMPEGAGEKEALESGEVELLPEGSSLSESSFERNGTTSTFSYSVSEDGEGAEAVTLPIFAYPLYAAVDEAGKRVEISGTEEGLIRFPLDQTPGLHSIEVHYEPPASLGFGLWGTLLGILALAGLWVKRRIEQMP